MTTYTPEYRRETADYIISTGRPVRQVAEELGINYKTANNWVVARKKQLSGEAHTTEVDADLLAAQKRILELEMDVCGEGKLPCKAYGSHTRSEPIGLLCLVQ